MANASDYQIITFQRKPGRWRANITPVALPSATRLGTSILGFVTPDDSDCEKAAIVAAHLVIARIEI
jgi:hypothetical protein